MLRVCQSAVSNCLQHTYSAVILLLVTAASDLLAHEILLNSVLGHNPLVCCRSWVGWGQDPASWVGQGQEYELVSVFNKNTRRVLSYTMSYSSRKRGLCQEGGGVDLPSSPAYKGPFIATQLNSTKLNSTSSCRHVHSVNNCHRSVLNVVTQ